MHSGALLQETITALVLYIQATLGVTGAIPNPEVKFMPQEEIAMRACGEHCSNVRGWFSYRDNVVYMTLDSDVLGNMYDRGVLLHELVHHVQHHRDSPRLHNDCATWKAREWQAYGIQYDWLHQNRVAVKTQTFNTLLVGFSRLDCTDATSFVSSGLSIE